MRSPPRVLVARSNEGRVGGVASDLTVSGVQHDAHRCEKDAVSGNERRSMATDCACRSASVLVCAALDASGLAMSSSDVFSMRFVVGCDFDQIVADAAAGGMADTTSSWNRQLLSDAVVVLDPERSLKLTRKTAAKMRKAGVRQIMAHVEIDPEGFWSE